MVKILPLILLFMLGCDTHTRSPLPLINPLVINSTAEVDPAVEINTTVEVDTRTTYTNPNP